MPEFTIKTINKKGEKVEYVYPRNQIHFTLTPSEIAPSFEAWNYIRNKRELATQFNPKELKTISAFAKTIFMNNIQSILDMKEESRKVE